MLSKRKYILWMAWRHLVSKKGKSLSFMTLISIFGIAIGVAALVLVLSVMGGFENDLKEKMFNGMPHLEIFAQNDLAGFSLNEHSLQDFQNLLPKATKIEPFTKADVILKRGKHLASVTLFGIDPTIGADIWGFAQGMRLGSIDSLNISPTPVNEHDTQSPPPESGLILGETLSVQLGAEVGDEVTILSPQAGVNDILSGGKLSMMHQVVGIFATDLPQYDARFAVVTLTAGRKFMADYDFSLDEGNYVTGVAVTITHPDEVEELVSQVRTNTDLKTQTWKQANSSLLFALKLEKFTMSAILLLIVLVAAFSISGTMMMTVFHKRGQVALLRSLGMGKKEISALFLVHGFIIGVVGMILGLLIGLAMCALIYYTQFIDLPADLYYQRKLPVKFLPLEYLVICLSAWVLSIIAALYPALVASRQDPGIGLRY